MDRINHFIRRLRNIHPRESARSFTHGRMYQRTTHFLQRRPFTAFLIGLLVLFGIIALGNFINSLNKPKEETKEVVKDVEVYNNSSTPSITVQAKVQKAGVIKIVAQTPGIVSSINVKEGATVSKGQTIVQLSTNYQGGNAPALQAQLAQKQYNNVASTYATQKEIIGKQREIADKTEANAEELRKIAGDSANDTQSLLDLNQDILTTINDTLTTLEETNVNGSNDQLIFQTKTQKSQVQAGVVQLQAQLRNLNYQKDSSKPPAELGILQKDITKKQLDIQEKALELSLEVGRIQKDLAWVQASLMSPSVPCQGTIERIYVKKGDSLNPGTPIALIKTNDTQISLEALLPADLAVAVSQTATSSAMVGTKPISLQPYYISQEATNGQLYSVLYTLPEDTSVDLTDQEFIAVTIPLGTKSSDAATYVPLDAVYQSQSEAYVYIVKGDVAESKKIILGDVYGKFVVVTSGLTGNEQIILNRNVVSGEKISVVH